MALLDKTGISLERLASFLQVSEVGSITRAANGETSRQVLISRQIRELEAFFGVKLTHRVGRGIELTDAGHELAKRTRECFRSLEDFQDGYAGRKRRVLIGAAGSILESLLIPRIKQINDKDFDLRIISAPTQDLAVRIEDGRLDLAILRENAITPRMDSRPIGEFGYNLWFPKALRIPRNSTIEHLLATVPLALPIGGTFRTGLDKAMHDLGIEMQVSVETNSFTQSAEALRTGSYGAILPEYMTSAAFQKNCKKLILPAAYAQRRRLTLVSLRNRIDLEKFFNSAIKAMAI